MNMKTCACGRRYDSDGWERLQRLGTMDDGEGGTLEIRNCECRSTISVRVTGSGELAISDSEAP